MTEMTMKLKTYIIDLLEFVQTKKGEEGEQWADSTASKQCFGHGEYVGNLRKWDGGKGSPTLEKTLQFERFLMNQIDDKEFEEFGKLQVAKYRAAARPSGQGAELAEGEIGW